MPFTAGFLHVFSVLLEILVSFSCPKPFCGNIPTHILGFNAKAMDTTETNGPSTMTCGRVSRQHKCLHSAAVRRNLGNFMPALFPGTAGEPVVWCLRFVVRVLGKQKACKIVSNL